MGRNLSPSCKIPASARMIPPGANLPATKQGRRNNLTTKDESGLRFWRILETTRRHRHPEAALSLGVAGQVSALAPSFAHCLGCPNCLVALRLGAGPRSEGHRATVPTGAGKAPNSNPNKSLCRRMGCLQGEVSDSSMLRY